jgi:light-regulated signal transduction histidine kinase (bacteriophytochrome)
MFARRLHPEDLSKLRETVANAYRNRSPGYDFEFRVILPSGETRWQSGRAAIFYGEDGSPQRILGVNVDITERRRVEEELRRSNTDLTQFAYAVSHDLKQPLRMISVFSQLLEKKYGAALDSRAREMVEIIAGAADRMDMLLKGLLEFSRLDSPHDRPDLVDCNDVVRAVLANLAAVVQETGAAVTVETLPRVYAHRVHLIQLFQNLLSNALKYRRPDVRCEIELRVQRTGSVWLFELEDNGLGIEPDQADYIFGIFKRLHGEAYEGTGIGLALCRRIVESYGGRIWVQSEPGNGSVFRFTIPVTESA